MQQVVGQTKNGFLASDRFSALSSRWKILTLFCTSFLGALALHLAIRKSVSAYPFGDRSGAIGDFATQYLPFYSRFREAIVEGNLSSILFAWDLGLGVSSLPDYATYLGGPWTLLVVLFPQEKILLSMTIIVLLKIALAAGLMRVLIHRLRPSLYGAIPLGLSLSYSATSWVLEQGQIIPQWLDAIYGIPLLFLIVLEMRKPRPRWVLGVLSVSLVWWGNYYVAYMASFLAGVFAITIAIGLDRPKDAIRNVGRFVGAGFLGVMLTAPTLLPTVRALMNGVGFQAPELLTPSRITDIALRTLPYTYDIYTSPMIYPGLISLLLCTAWVFSRSLDTRFKTAWTVSSLLIFGSLIIKPLLTTWNIFQTPHGSIYRWTFVVPAWLIVTAALAVEIPDSKIFQRKPTGSVDTYWPNYWQIIGITIFPVFVFAVLLLAVDGSDIILGSRKKILVFTLLIGTVLALLLALMSRKGSKFVHIKILLNLVLIGAISLELFSNGVFAGQQLRARFYSEATISSAVEGENLDYANHQTRMYWPEYRLGYGYKPDTEWWMVNNLSARYLYPGTDYYSTTVTSEYAQAPQGIGFQSSGGGRFTLMSQDSLLQSIVGAVNDSELPFLPMVRAYEEEILPDNAVPSIYSKRMMLANSTSGYSFPAFRVERGDQPVSNHLSADAFYDISTSCDVGNVLFLAPTSYVHSAKTPWPVEVLESSGVRPTERGIFGEIGTAVKPTQEFRVKTNTDVILETNMHIGCANLSDLRRDLESVIKPRTIDIQPGKVEATFDAPVSGQVVVATPAIAGWSCYADGAPSRVTERAGLLATDVTRISNVACSFRPPLFIPGIGVGTLSMLIMIGLQVYYSRRP